MGSNQGWQGSESFCEEKVAGRTMSKPMLIRGFVSPMILSGCATQSKTNDKPGVVGVQMQSNTLAGSLQYGLKF